MAKCDWTMEEAKRWVEAHKDFTVPEEDEGTEGKSAVVTESDMTAWTTDTTAPGNNAALGAAIKDLTAQVGELKEGRVLNTKNRTLVKDTIDALTTLKERLEELYNATEPPAREEGKEPKEGEFILEKNGKQDSLDDSITSVVEKVLGGDRFGKMINDAVKDAFDVGIKKKLGKVE